MHNLLLIALGIALLAAGGEALVRGALAAAQRLGLSPLLCGLVIVGFGTSIPELVVSVLAALNQQPDIAIGNVVGSNIGNIALILGLCALITPLSVKPGILQRDALTAVAASVLFALLTVGRSLGPTAGVFFLTGLAAYLIWAFRSERRAPDQTAFAAGLPLAPASPVWMIAGICAGLALLIGGSQVLLHGAIGIAEHMGVSATVIGLTLVAVGTSLPELTVSLVAVFRRHADVAVGNILGSNIFNLLGILGISALVQPLTVSPRILVFDQWVMIATMLLLWLFLYTGRQVSRLEGGILLVCYALYVSISFVIFG